MHFGYHQDEPVIRSGQYELQIPLRHPMEVAKSWAQRNKNIKALLQAYESMFKHIGNGVPHQLHKIEDIPRLAGTDDNDRETITGQWAVDDYQGEVLLLVVGPHLEFFKQYYG